MFSTMNNQRKSFPQLVGQYAQQAAAYVAALGFNPQILRQNDPMTRDLRMDRVRMIVDPTRTIVLQTPVVG